MKNQLIKIKNYFQNFVTCLFKVLIIGTMLLYVKLLDHITLRVLIFKVLFWFRILWYILGKNGVLNKYLWGDLIN